DGLRVARRDVAQVVLEREPVRREPGDRAEGESERDADDELRSRERECDALANTERARATRRRRCGGRGEEAPEDRRQEKDGPGETREEPRGREEAHFFQIDLVARLISSKSRDGREDAPEETR